MGISDSALPIYLAHGFKYMRYLPRFVRIYDPDAVEPISELTPLGKRVLHAERPLFTAKHEARRIEFAEPGEHRTSVLESRLALVRR